MFTRRKDVTLADGFTKITHSHPTPALNPSTDKPKISTYSSSRIPRHRSWHSLCLRTSRCCESPRRARISSKELSSVARKAHDLAPSVPVTCFPVDITSSESVKSLAQDVKEKAGRLDILVLDSGDSGPVALKIDDGDPQDLRDSFDVNVQGTYPVVHHLIPLLRESEGAKTFIVVNSLAALITSGHIANTAYCVSKLAQARLIEYIAEQYGKEVVLAIALHPGAMLTEMAKQTAPQSMMPHLTDDFGLCGAFCVWLSREKKMWLNGRLVSATWDVNELLEKRDQVETGDLLKIGFRVGDASAALLNPERPEIM